MGRDRVLAQGDGHVDDVIGGPGSLQQGGSLVGLKL